MRHCRDVRIQDRGWMDFPYDQMGIEWGRTSDDDDNNKPKVGWSAWSAINIRQPSHARESIRYIPRMIDGGLGSGSLRLSAVVRSLLSGQGNRYYSLYPTTPTHTYTHTTHLHYFLSFFPSNGLLYLFLTLHYSCRVICNSFLSFPFRTSTPICSIRKQSCTGEV